MKVGSQIYCSLPWEGHYMQPKENNICICDSSLSFITCITFYLQLGDLLLSTDCIYILENYSCCSWGIKLIAEALFVATVSLHFDVPEYIDSIHCLASFYSCPLHL